VVQDSNQPAAITIATNNNQQWQWHIQHLSAPRRKGNNNKRKM